MQLFATDPLLSGPLGPSTMVGVTSSQAAAMVTAWRRYLAREQQACASRRVLNSLDLSQQILNLLLGPAAIRPRCWELSPANADSLVATIGRYVSASLPIDCITMAGAVKHYGFSAHRGVDFADVLWLRRFLQLQTAVSAVYRPGIRVRLILEDNGERILDTTVDDLEDRICRYVHELRALSQVVTGDLLEIVPESLLLPGLVVSASAAQDFQLISGSPVTFTMFKEVAARAAVLFANYLAASVAESLVPLAWNRIPPGHDELPAFKALQAVGFKGGIPLEQREYYVRCAQNGCGRILSPDEGRAEVANYLGVVLARARLGIVRGRVTDARGEIPPVKLSFMPTAPGSPPELERNRIEYVACTRGRKSGRHVSAWSGFGGFGSCASEIHPGIWSPHERRQMDEAASAELKIPSKDSAHELSVPILLS